ncbi:MAG: hypothetical protein IJH04_03680, partial [Eggerthellaceae bacterium]|nr:hypothetical protein [Eggerthellaceae bacterium]
MDERFEIHGFASASDVAARALRCLMAGVLILLVMWIPAGNAYAEGEYYEEGEALGTDEEAQESSDDAGKEASVEMVAMESNATSVDRAPENIVDPTQRADNSFIYDTSISSLFEESSLHDGQIVQVEGEVIGDRIVNTRG